MSDIQRLEPRKEYIITEFRTFQSKFGKKLIVTDIDFNTYFVPKKVEDFIQQNNIINKGGEEIFKIITGPAKTYVKKFDDEEKEITTIDCRCLKIGK